MRNAQTAGRVGALLSIACIAIGVARTAAAEEVQGIYLREKGSLAMLNFRYAPQLLFKNGEVYTDIAVPLEDLDIAASKQAEPERWGQWRKEGDQVYFDLPEGEKKVKLYKNAVVPAADNLQLEGVWSHQFASVSIDSQSSFVLERDIGFSANGIYATGKFTGGSGSGTGGTATGYSSEGLSPKGTYRISGYTVEFTQQDGSVKRELFFFYPENDGSPDYETINVGVTHFQREQDTFSAELSGGAPSQGEQQATVPSSPGGDGIPITPGRWQFESYTAAGELEETDDYCLTKPVFDPMQIVGAEDWDHCEVGPPVIDGRHGVYNMACSGSHEGQTVQIGFKFDLTIENDQGQGQYALARRGAEGFVMGEPYGLKIWRSGDC